MHHPKMLMTMAIKKEAIDRKTRTHEQKGQAKKKPTLEMRTHIFCKRFAMRESILIYHITEDINHFS